MIQLTFHFDSIDAAQQFLDATQGRQRPQVTADMRDLAEKLNAEAKKERKPRSDAGQPRGPYKRKDELPVEAAAPATQTPADTPPAVPAAAAPVSASAAPAQTAQETPVPAQSAAPAAATLTLADVRAAMTGRSTDKNIALLRKFGYAKSSDLPQEKYASFIEACKRGE